MVSNQSPLSLERMPAQAVAPQVCGNGKNECPKGHSSSLESSTRCTPSGSFRREIFFSLKLIESLRNKLHANREGRPDETGFLANNIRDEIESARFDIESLYQTRAEYWIGLMLVSKSDDKETLMSMHIMHQDLTPAIHHGLTRPNQVMDPVICFVSRDLNDQLFILANRLPTVPSLARVITVLKELDEKSLTWDDDQPTLLLDELLRNKG
jgi:hypothetical protein